MKRTANQLLALLLALVLTVGTLSASVFAISGGNSAVLSAAQAAPGGTAEVTLTLTTQDQASHFYVEICCDDELPLQAIDAGSLHVEQDEAQGGYSLDIYNDAGKQTLFAPGTYTVKLTYQLPADAAVGDTYELYLDSADTYDKNGRTPAGTDTTNGKITVQASVTLDKAELRLNAAGETAQLTAATNPAGITVVWSSSDERVAKVDENGLVTAVSAGAATVTAAAGSATAQCSVLVTADAAFFPVYFFPMQEGATVKVSDYTAPISLYSYTHTVAEGEHAGTHEGYVALLKPGSYTYTVTKSGYYGSTCGFTVKADGSVAFRQNWTDAIKTQYGLNSLLDGANAMFYPDLEVFTKSSNPGAWDGVTLDVSWFNPNETTHTVSTPAQFAGLAAIVNGIYNDEIETIIDLDASGSKTEYTPEQYAALDSAKIQAGCTSGNSTGSNNLISTSDYYFSALGYDFDGHTVSLAADLDMGGYQKADGSWTGARYMPIGGQYVMRYVKTELSDGYSHLGASFNGKLEGNGHLIYNIYCDRYSNGANFGDSQSIGLIGRLGNHDSDYSTWKSLEGEGKNGNYGGNYPAVNPTVRNVAVAGYVYGRRSVGGIVGKIGQTSASNLSDGTVGGLIENCVNFATVHNTDSKGVGGIVGASWNRGAVRNCVNFGNISTIFNCPTGGIVGSNEIPVMNCYNMGQISAKQSRYAMAIGTNNGGGTDVRNCYWLTGSAAGGGYYGSMSDKTQVKEITDNYNGTTLTATGFMQSSNFISLLNGTDSRTFKQAATSDPIYKLLAAAGYAGAPIPRIFTADTASVTRIGKTSDPAKLTYVEGERFDPTGLELRAYWSDGTEEKLENYTYSIDRPLALGDTKITVTVSTGSRTESFSFDITVIPVSLEKISISTQPTRRAYNEGDFFDPAGLCVQIDYTNGTSVKAAWKNGTFVSQEDGSAIPGTITLSISTDRSLTMEHDGKAVTVSHTFTDGATKTADTSVLTIISIANKPKQEDGVYLVGTADELNWIAAQVNNAIAPELKARLTADITASKDFEPIGTSSNEFTGTFDGDYHRITLSLERNKMYTALFGSISDATVKNIIVDGSVTVGTSGSYVAGIVGCASGSSLIENCGNEAVIASGRDYLGGVVGKMEDSTVVRGCYNWGSVTNSASRIKTGGITGEISGSDCVVENCYNWGTVTGDSRSSSYGVGGIAGVAQTYNMKMIKNVYNAGTIIDNSTSNRYNGAIIGSGYADKVENYYWLEGCGTELPFGRQDTTDGKLSADALKAAAAKLGASFKENKSGYPLLTWQADNAHVHSWGDWTQTKVPSCTDKGEEARTCSVGGETETREIATLEHNWDDWTQTKAPTCTGKGEEARTCSVGGETETREIAALEHTDEDHNYRCDRCGELLKEAPKLLSGDGQEWTKGSKTALRFTSDAAREDFLRVCVDGKELAPENYTLSDDATTVTLHAEYLETLAIGGYRLRIESRNGAAEAGFRVAASPASPATGDSFALFVFLPLAAFSAAMLLLLLKKKRAF